MDKLRASAAAAVADIPDGASLAVGGFGLSGVPEAAIRALHEQGATGLEVVSNNCGVDGRGLGVLLAAGRIARVTGARVAWAGGVGDVQRRPAARAPARRRPIRVTIDHRIIASLPAGSVS